MMNETSENGDHVFTTLIVGDDTANLGVLAETLEELSCHVLFARDSAKGLELAVYTRPDLIFMDVIMPGIDGFETCRRLKKNKKTRHIPVILITTGADKKVVVKAFNSGAVDYIFKPFLIEEITARIKPRLLLNSTERSLQQELTLNTAMDNFHNLLANPTKSVLDIGNVVLEQAKSLTLSKYGYVSEIDPVNGDNIVLTFTEMMKASCKLQKTEHRKIRFPRQEDGHYPGLWGHCLNTRKPFYTNSPKTHPASKGCPQGHIPIERFLSVPVMLADEPVGQIALANKKEDYTNYDLAAIFRLGELYAVAVQRRRWEKALWKSEQNKLKDSERSRRALLSILEDQKQAEEKIKASLREKEVLLREIHHRVKNNLQIVSSLLQLQAGYATDEQTVRMFNDSQLQIRTMALVHEKLYRNEDMSMVDLGDYANAIAENLFQFCTDSSGRIRLTLEIENIFMSIDKAIPCGMIINELVSNSLEHGFPGDLRGEIGIRLISRAQNGFELTVYDTGTGIPENVDFRQAETLGLHLVTILTEDQLLGKIELDKSNGTKFRIQF